MEQSIKYSPSVRLWLLIGVLMVFIQVVVGGITRLTESGLSITKWEVVDGTLPPMSAVAWEEAFSLYKETPQYREINEGMSLQDFKFIFFWEWVHRFWARFMGFVFLIPFIYFVGKGLIDKALLLRLGLVVFLALMAAIFGWIMVASGLVNRPWVNAYKLSIHLGIAFSVFAALWWTYLNTGETKDAINEVDRKRLKKLLMGLTLIFIIQMILGGILSGMKAAVVFPSWPDMNGQYLPKVIFDSKQWTLDNFIEYDKNIFLPSLIHFLHRNTAYILFCFGLLTGIKLFKIGETFLHFRIASIMMIIILCVQVLLGIITVLKSQGIIPVLWGTLHQAFALFFLATLVYTFFILRINKKKNLTILPLD